MFPSPVSSLGRKLVISWLALALGACSHTPPEVLAPPLPGLTETAPLFLPEPVCEEAPPPGKGTERDLEDLSRIPQRIEELPALSGGGVALAETCQQRLLDQFQREFYKPWTRMVPLLNPQEAKSFMINEAKARWNGVNKRRVPHEFLQKLLDNCALDSFPSRNAAAIAVAPGHLRGLPTPQPLYNTWEDAPFDMLAFPQLKLNEPLRVLHISRDGAWYFVESASSSGWVETRDVAFVDQALIDEWIRTPKVVILRDDLAIADGKGIATSRVKLGTILPISGEGEGHWTLRIASAGEGGKAEIRSVQIAGDSAARFPLTFDNRTVAQVGDSLLGQPYGWGELYDLRDCSALLRDFFMPFGIWLPRTSGDQIASTGHPVRFNHASAQARAELIKAKGLPFLTLLYKPGHIMLYVGVDKDGQPLVYHASWSIRVKDGNGGRTLVTGVSAITTLELGKELGLVPGWSLLEKITEMGSVTDRCR
ncbi:SH3 domain-containing protein [Geomonas sp.]|uniref:SH3 domain-containing protein n=1 Tax=Geomonas sp. TaxID=2651584 RepID=UPI002B487BF1|nr:SH3 domain-containing protein [Geomonas sp.]HJV34994.1 SH3 domain-containing protein [Geomonas sp.]